MGSRKHGRSGHATQSRDRSGAAQDTLSVRFTASKKNPGKGDKRRGTETRDSWMGYPTALIAKGQAMTGGSASVDERQIDDRCATTRWRRGVGCVTRYSIGSPNYRACG